MWIYYFLDIYISSYMDPIVILGRMIRALIWSSFLDPSKGLWDSQRPAPKAPRCGLWPASELPFCSPVCASELLSSPSWMIGRLSEVLGSL